MNGFMEDPETNINSPIGLAESVTTTHIAGARYCWSIAVQAPEATDMPMAQRGAYTQQVTIRMTLSPD